MDFGYRQPIEWWDDVPLGGYETRIIEVGFVNSGRTLVHITSHCFITWGIITEQVAQFDVHGDGSINFANPDLMFTQGIAAATYTTPYNLGAPLNQVGSDVLTRPFIRLRLRDTSHVDHAYTRFYAKVW